MSIGRVLIVLCIAALAGWAGWHARGKRDADSAASAARSTRTVSVARGRMEQSVKARGIVKAAPNALVRVGFPMPKDVARRISQLTLVPGDTVHTGEILATLDDADLRATLRDLNGQMQAFERRLEALRMMQPVDLKVAESTRAEHQAQLDHAQRVYERLEKLGTKSAASILEWETAITARDVSRAKLEAAEATLQQVRTQDQTDIRVLEAQVAQAKAAIENIQVQIEWSSLRSPVDGQVFAVNQYRGELTSNMPNTPVLTLLDPKQLELHLYVDEVDFGRIRKGQEVTFRVDAYPGEILQGTIVRMLPQPILQENVVYYLAVVEVVERQRSLLRVEMTALAHVRAEVNENALWLPLESVQSRSDGWYALRPGVNGPVKTAVQIGWKDEGRVEIRQGLAEGDEVLLGP